MRQGTVVVRSLLEEASRAELDQKGLLIDLGTPDQHKYTGQYVLRRWMSTWGPHHVEGQTTFLDAAGHPRLRFYEGRGGVRRVVLRARSRGRDQTCLLRVNDEDRGSRTLSEAWSLVEYPLDPPTKPGRLTLDLLCAGAPGLQIDAVWLGREGGPPVLGGIEQGVLTFGEPRRALMAPTARTVSYYLVVPRAAALVFDYGAQQATEFAVALATDGARAQLFHARATPGAWREARVDLSRWAGVPVRLDLVTRGPDGAAGWAEPDLVREAPATKVPSLAARPRHLIHVLIDAARQDLFRAFNPKSPVRAPALNALAERSTVFTSAYATGNWTLPSVSGFLSGRYAFTFLAEMENAKVSTAVPLLQEHLRQRGFTTAAFMANHYTSELFGLGRGWDHMRHYAKDPAASHADQMYADVIAWLRAQVKERPDKRFFIYVHAMEPHAPYEHHGPFTEPYLAGRTFEGRLPRKIQQVTYPYLEQNARLLSEDDRRTVRGLYHGEITFHDAQLGRLIEELRRLGLFGQTMVVVSSDHGEEMFERGATGHGDRLFEEVTRVPLVIHFPPLFPPGRRVTDIVELLDLLPTELEALGVPPTWEPHGRSLLPSIHGAREPSGSSAITIGGGGMAVRLGAFKLIHFPRTNEDALFDLAADPDEKVNLATSHPVALRACEIVLAEGLAVPFKTRRTSSLDSGQLPERLHAVIDGDVRKRLQALGYLQ